MKVPRNSPREATKSALQSFGCHIVCFRGIFAICYGPIARAECKETDLNGGKELVKVGGTEGTAVKGEVKKREPGCETTEVWCRSAGSMSVLCQRS